jgi:hypothetical protein
MTLLVCIGVCMSVCGPGGASSGFCRGRGPQKEGGVLYGGKAKRVAVMLFLHGDSLEISSSIYTQQIYRHSLHDDRF